MFFRSKTATIHRPMYFLCFWGGQQTDDQVYCSVSKIWFLDNWNIFEKIVGTDWKPYYREDHTNLIQHLENYL